MALAVMQPGRVRVRLISQGTGPGATTILGRSFVPSEQGLNGTAGWQTGNLDGPRLGEEGDFAVTFANTVGTDGVLHRDRFAILTDPTYRAGDEWLEVYRENELLAVWTPTKANVDRGTITLTGYDAFWLLKRSREFQAGFWMHAPRDVIEHYTGVWQSVYADDLAVASRSGRTIASGVPTFTADGMAAAGGTTVYVNGAQIQTGSLAWRAECQMRITAPGTNYNTDAIQFGMMTPSGGSANGVAMLWFAGQPIMQTVKAGVSTIRPASPVTSPIGTPVSIAIERRDRWIFYYVAGLLVGVLPADLTANVPLVPTISLSGATSAVFSDWLVREHQALLSDPSDPGDYRLPGEPTPGGLQAKYWPAVDEAAKYGNTQLGREMSLAPTKGDPAGVRLEPTVDINTNGRVDGFSRGVHFATRWTGSAYLDLAAHDIQFRAIVDDHATVWVGRTTYADRIINDGPGTLTTAGLRATLGSLTGWYALRVDFFQWDNVLDMRLQWSSDGGSTWAVIPSTALSPYGLFESQVRSDSHYDTLRAITDGFGYQITCSPRQLESGAFPGVMVPRLRVGRDTDYELGETEATAIAAAVDAESSCDVLQADAAGIADPNGGAQLSAEVADYTQLGNHLFASEDYESLSDITEPSLLAQRLNSLLELHGDVFEQVDARPRGHTELRDTFPLTGALSKFAWGPGDGVRLTLPSVGVVDTVPRQIIGVSRDITPAGLKPPTASFRQRPRSRRDTIRKLVRQVLNPQRNYQGQLAQLSSTSGSNLVGFAAFVHPTNNQMVSATLEVTKTDSSPWNVVVNSATVFAVTDSGSYDITAYAPLGSALLVSQGSGSTGTWSCRMVATVRI